MEEKKIIHFKIPAKTRFGKVTDFAVHRSRLKEFLDAVCDKLGKGYIVMATPFDIDTINAEYEKVKLDELTLKEFLEKYEIPLDKQ